jgi:putative DNA primase/helicase
MPKTDSTSPSLTFPAPRARVEVGNHIPLYQQVDDAWTALVEANDEQMPRVLVRGNSLIRMTERGELEEFTVDSLRDELSRVADFGYESKDGWRSCKPPTDVAKMLLGRDSADYIGASFVDRVVDVPVLEAGGSIITRPGHHAKSRIYYRPTTALSDTDLEAGPPELVDEVVEARDFLMTDVLGDFEFADQGSRAHALGLLLLPFVRDYIDGPTPMHVILAPEPGTGKSLLAQSALYPGCGLVAITAADRDHNDEWRKSLTSTLMAGGRAVIFDNLSGQLDSGPLAAALTSGVWTDRVLGYTKQVTLPVRNVWVATGNNLDLSDEQARRAVPIFLDPGAIRPSDRPTSAYRHPDLLGWSKENRAQTVKAALTLVRHWSAGWAQVAAGGHEFYRDESAPVFGTTTLGSFGGWAKTVGGLLESVDVEGFLSKENRDRLFAEANEETRDAAAFLSAWLALGLPPVSTAELVEQCGLGGPLRSVVPTDMAGLRNDKLAKPMAYWLRDHKNRRIGGFQLLHDRDSRAWSVRSV